MKKKINNHYQKTTINFDDFIDPVLGKSNIRRTLEDRAEAMRREYEAFDLMHRNDKSIDESSSEL